ncbi:hypothetical protein BCY89_22110 [Sphingobacterium siyangense]|jgi:ATP/maltotriose-dependent transcriptional regulator MalT|uniref:Uncharacterized protein n=1 Tax=Sphingobacterium siyangense TaxID=459529 RepID=A0A420G7D5_9SPHI|nr:hypothetical protein [Sphingobacterium siyangense]QRY57949.1 hypothetical protein JVX97_00260 [Sphingobacterium siyangense]RKF41111.1 hypothetical protein BCY89_22110 [Sphingobacterium siyangense]
MLKINEEQWQVAKEKLRRKYNHLSDEDLAFQAGEEDKLINRLSLRLGRKPSYVLFTIGKEIEDISSNRL